ncbi:FAD-binding monooxygenase [Streptomyces sp. ISL-98]|uniref:FAD-dependent oxidoreductase n=1 Tax=Streptomyces sp. ISL-98 TaxID=2819192 RepID=UPI001BEBC917|nr:FAD-binding monooxygenase [Streptomyces sp. ISL-98]MBT2511622.1 FAD-binding monooxygenase [Streptomyces sp. ISL-98]
MSHHHLGRTHVRPVGGPSVVVGASMAGLCAARVLSERFDHVVVIDRDKLPNGPEWRHQVPQGRHPHFLLRAGAQHLEWWFPGIVEELEAGGAVDVDVCRDLYWYESGGVMRRPASELHGPAMSRPFLEATVRRRVEALPNVTLLDETVAEGLETDASGTRITGVRLDDGSTIASGLTVDATGRQARSLGWLKTLGYEAPSESVVTVDTRYATRVYRRTELPVRDWKAAAVIGNPDSKRLALALPTEGERWIVTLVGLGGESPPTDEAERLAYAESFESPVIADIMAASEPIGETVAYRFAADQRRHMERMRRFPLGWVPVGDAVCSFNPIYGQGMTTAAQQAAILGTCLDRTGATNRSFSHHYLRAAGRSVSVPWSIAVGRDFAYDGTTGKKPAGTDLVNRYTERVAVAAQHDDAVGIRSNAVAGLVRRPESLLTPAYVFRVLRFARHGPIGPSST